MVQQEPPKRWTCSATVKGDEPLQQLWAWDRVQLWYLQACLHPRGDQTGSAAARPLQQRGGGRKGSAVLTLWRVKGCLNVWVYAYDADMLPYEASVHCFPDCGVHVVMVLAERG